MITLKYQLEIPINYTLFPVFGAGDVVSQNTASRSVANLNVAEYK
jgi:hypothetical protein